MNVSQYWNLHFSPLILYLNYLSRKKKMHSSPNLRNFYYGSSKTPVYNFSLIPHCFLFKDSLVGFPCGSAGKESACNAGDLDLITGLGRSPGEGKSYPLQNCGLENSMDCIVHGVAKSRVLLGDIHFHFPFLGSCVSTD